MASPADQPLIAALDIGSSKVGALICTLTDDGRLQVLGTGQRESRGVKRGYVTDMEASEHAVREAVELAERMSGLTIEDVWASFGAGGLASILTAMVLGQLGLPRRSMTFIYLAWTVATIAVAQLIAVSGERYGYRELKDYVGRIEDALRA